MKLDLSQFDGATPGKWTWWTSCSWRRLKSELENGQLEAQVQILRKALSGLVSIIDNDNPWDAGNVAAFNAAVAEAREALSRTSLTSQGESDGN